MYIHTYIYSMRKSVLCIVDMCDLTLTDMLLDRYFFMYNVCMHIYIYMNIRIYIHIYTCICLYMCMGICASY